MDDLPREELLRNPLLALATALIRAILYLLNKTRALVALLTITLPYWVVRILGYSLTLQLDFTKLFLLFALAGLGIFIIVRYRYLTKYSQLQDEVPLAPLNNHLFNPSLTVPDEYNRPTAFHNYLDEFLAAIRIFGFLEKPVFHELSRHLQTKRLIAGDTISLGEDKNFYCVVDGNVQVFAKSNRKDDQNESGHESSSGLFNGYHLLNTVGPGGTLSSLFSILSLFTEDVHLSWDGDASAGQRGRDGGNGKPSRRSRAGSESSMGASLDGSGERDIDAVPSRFRDRANSDVSNFAGLGAGSSDRRGFSPLGREMEDHEEALDLSSEAEGTHVPTHRTNISTSLPVTANGSPSITPVRRTAPPLSRRDSFTSTADGGGTGLGSGGFATKEANMGTGKGTRHSGLLARATVDTTLAVIPSEAFRRLTRKFPKASGHIVSVILTRFSRVTFVTAHKYLGLTREVLQAENELNKQMSYPLPASFYEQGGMQRLRERFQPEPKLPDNSVVSSPDGLSTRSGRASTSDLTVMHNDYFGFTPITPVPSRPSDLPHSGSKKRKAAAAEVEARTETSHVRPADVLSRQNTYRYSSPNRKLVAAGDLGSGMGMALAESQQAHLMRMPSRFSARTPRASAGSWKMSPTIMHGPSDSLHSNNTRDSEIGSMRHVPMDDDLNLRDVVLESIGHCIGLLHRPPSADSEQPSAAVSNARSTPNSPFFGGTHTMSQSAFSGLSMLDMLQAARSKTMMTDDASSVTGTMADAGVPSNPLADLENQVDIQYFKAGTTLVREGEKSPGLFYVIDGFLDISMTARKDNQPTMRGLQSNTSSNDDEHLFTIKSGGIAGYLASLCNTASYVHITAKTDVYVGLLPHRALERLTETKPIVLLTLAKRLISLLSPLVLNIDASLDWRQLTSGEVLYRKGDESDSFYFVINGRLRSVVENEDGQVELVSEHGQGSTCGELEAITGVERPHTLHAIRDSELVRMPMALFNAVSIQHPGVTIQFLRLIASRLVPSPNVPRGLGSPGKSIKQAGASGANMDLKTVCIIPTTRAVPVIKFAEQLRHALEDIGAPTSYLTQGIVMEQLGRHAFSRFGNLKIAGWLSEQEQRYRIVLYVVDTPVASQWTTTAIRQADFVLVVGTGDDVSVGEYEKVLLGAKTTARKELVLLHPERSVPSGSTRRWLKDRSYISAHHHVELQGILPERTAIPIEHDPSAVAAFKHLRERVGTKLKQAYRVRPKNLVEPRKPPHMNDFARIARRLCGKSIGLVLGGGGARGISHIGFLEALEEKQIPVDIIGGCSIGAFVGGLYAREADLLLTTGRAKQFAGRMSSLWRVLSDVTYPFAAYTTGHEFNRGIYKAFYDVHIEDFWIPYFCNSTNITHSRMEIHRFGYAWRYIRASMTLAGLLPPLSDRGDLLVDGGYIDNLPVTKMAEFGPAHVIAIDVGAIDDTSPRVYGDSVSGWGILLTRLNPFAKRTVLSMTEVSSRLTYVSSVRNLDEAKAIDGCLYYAMPVQDYDTLGGFAKFSEVYRIGLECGRTILKTWDKEGKLPNGLVNEARTWVYMRDARIRLYMDNLVHRGAIVEPHNQYEAG